MEKHKEDFERKISTAREAISKLNVEREQLEATVAPMNARLAKLRSDLDYWERRIVKLNQQQEASHG